jgi:glutathione S-transferase
MQVYGLPLSPFVRKVHLVAAEKGIEFETVPTDFRNPAPEFLEASPFRKIPALRDGDFTLADSTAIATYFDALHPEPPILPSGPKARAKAVFFEEVADTVFIAAGSKVVFNRFVGPKLLGMPGDEAAAAEGEKQLGPLLDWLEGQAPASGWLAGESFSIGDIAMASVLQTLSYVGMGPEALGRPAILAWFERVRARPAWQQVAKVEAEVARQLA